MGGGKTFIKSLCEKFIKNVILDMRRYLVEMSAGVDPKYGNSASKENDRNSGQNHEQGPAPAVAVGT